jgi:hypothetical protein
MPSRRRLSAILAAFLLLLPAAGCKYLLIVNTTGGHIFFAFSGGHVHGKADAVRVVNAQKTTVRSLAAADSSAAGDTTATRVAWDLKDDAGRRVPAGSYTARLYIDGVVVEESRPIYVSSP